MRLTGFSTLDVEVLVYDLHLHLSQKLLSLELKTRPKQPLGYLQLLSSPPQTSVATLVLHFFAATKLRCHLAIRHLAYKRFAQHTFA